MIKAKTALTALIGTLALAASAAAQDARFTPPTTWSTASAYPGGGGTTAMTVPVYTPPYSYYAATTGPARIYVPLNAADSFPFHGRPYGHPGDRWSWGTLQGSNPYLQRYFVPPVR